jgi:hypothetical protein
MAESTDINKVVTAKNQIAASPLGDKNKINDKPDVRKSLDKFHQTRVINGILNDIHTSSQTAEAMHSFKTEQQNQIVNEKGQGKKKEK